MFVNRKSAEYFARQESGGKGYNLYLMTKLGLPVPAWVVLGRSVFEEYIQSSGLVKKLPELLGKYEDKLLDANQLAYQIEYLFLSTPLTPSTKTEIKQAYSELYLDDKDLISVRSSAADEDSVSYSFAGQLSSYLYVDGLEDAERYVRKCWASAYTERGIVYRRENGLSLENISVAVVLQKMIDPQVSGVMFTCNPIADVNSDEAKQFIVNSAYGVGEGLVSGVVDGDTFWLAPENGSLVSKSIVDKELSFSRGPSGECVETKIGAEKSAQESLSVERLQELWAFGNKLRNYFGEAQDIEWAIDRSQIYLLQTRPVTTLKENTTGFPNLWDNSNIVESYGGITSPLTFTFALDNYRGVYYQFCEILGVPSQVVKEMDYYLANMLGSINGRVFYNLYNWYKLVGILPGFKQNREFMEVMMGVGQSLSDEIEKRIEPHPSWSTLSGKIRKFKTGIIFLYYHFAIQKVVDNFLLEFDREYQIARKQSFETMSSDQLFLVFVDIKNRFLGKWKAPIINDFLCMIHFGLLKKLTDKWLGSNDKNIQNDLLAGEGGLESAEPTKAIIRFAVEVESNSKLKELIMSTSNFQLLEALNQSEFSEFYSKVCEYIDLYGYRCMSEMKMEEKDLTTDPSFLFVCMKNYLKVGTDKILELESRERGLREKAETIVNRHLSGWKKLGYAWSLKNTRKAVKNRENTRFARTRIYGLARTVFHNMGIRMSQANIIDKPDDIYYLTMQEVYGSHQGTLTGQNLKSIVNIRKDDYLTYKDTELKIRFQTRGLVYNGNYLDEGEPPIVPEGVECDLSGVGCCPGVVEGRVRVIHSAKDDLSINGEILVAKQTDPGWVPIFPSISGLLVERGGLLSHSAIVAREMGIPAVVGITGLLNTLKDGMMIRMDGQAGTITILEKSTTEVSD